MKRADLYQVTLICLGVAATGFMVYFLGREIFPEYKTYQNAYLKLEEYRSSYTGEPPVAFKKEVKQILLPVKGKGPEDIDRCISCHVAMDLPHFSPTSLVHDINGNVVLKADGAPLLEPNPDYIWDRLDKQIAELSDEKKNQQLVAEGQGSERARRLKLAEELKALKTATVDGRLVDLSKVLQMHPLMGKETRPFEFHPYQEYGCTVCHSGNGRGIVTDKAHGPIYDGQYEVGHAHASPQFTESDAHNDPAFAQAYNSQPGHELIFQTTPLMVGPLIQSRCVQCHQPSSAVVSSALADLQMAVGKNTQESQILQKAIEQEKQTVQSLLEIQKNLEDKGLKGASQDLEKRAADMYITSTDLAHVNSQLSYLKALQKSLPASGVSLDASAKQDIHRQLLKTQASLLEKMARLSTSTGEIQTLQQNQPPLDKLLSQTLDLSQASGQTEMDRMLANYRNGEQLFISQACYACHRIDGFSRGGVGPELTREGLNYPWFVKETIVWPQGQTINSTMPNFGLDQEDVQDLMTFLMAQRGDNKTVAPVKNQIDVKAWENGRKTTWEKALQPNQIDDIRHSMLVFGTQGCASCHKLHGFESNVGFSIQKNLSEVPYEALQKEKEWFRDLFPETISGSQIVAILEKQVDAIDRHIVEDVRQGGVLEQIEHASFDGVSVFYAPFKFAERAKNHYYQQLAEAAKDPAEKERIAQLLAQWKKRVHRVMMMFVQEYGLGRLIAPRLNWSGVFRSDEWLMEHFWNPSSHTPRSIMPVMPFDNTKFYALTNMLDELGRDNSRELHAYWNHYGFSPELAFQTYCAQCHGETRHGNGPVSEWIYPVPKNLRNADFLRNLTKAHAIDSITHGVKGTPMPPWGELAPGKGIKIDGPVLSQGQIVQLVDWLFSDLAGGRALPQSEVLKWQYTPQDVWQELQREDNASQLFLAGKAPAAVATPAISKPAVPATPAGPSEPNAAALFDVTPNPQSAVEPELYYIKSKFYTEKNLKAGQEFFVLNCAACHGKEGDGAGARSEVMTEAKPRMLINLDWLHTRDDLRLMRSIKFGVPGTAMTPWGDLTSTLQRMQLVMFIRSLSSNGLQRQQLNSAVYQSFGMAADDVFSARSAAYSALVQAQDLLHKSSVQLAQLQLDLQQGQGQVADLASALKAQAQLQKKVVDLEAEDKLYRELGDSMATEGQQYAALGENILNHNLDKLFFQGFIHLIELNKSRIVLVKGQLHFALTSEAEEMWNDRAKQLIMEIEAISRDQQAQLKIWQDKPASGELNKTQQTLQAENKGIIGLKTAMQTTFESMRQNRQKQKELLSQIGMVQK